ncbi:MAG: hypothetical protein RJA36_1543 [Pseudomonadota bacterium]|jgi:hypothetical protein
MKPGVRSGLIALLLCWQVAQGAGPSAPGTTAAPAFAPEKIIQLAKKVEKVLAGRGARVGIIGRIGRPASEMPEGMRYTHAAFAVYSEITTADGRQLPGYATFNEYQGEQQPDTSSLVQDYPVDFYASVAELEAGVIIPSAELQRRLLAVITSPIYPSLHEPRYSAIANPYTLGRQNCTEFVLDIIHAAIYQTGDIEVIKANERAFFVAQTVNVNPVKLLLGSFFSAEISMSDQPSLPPVTATFETLGRYLQQYDRAEVFYLSPD